MRNMNYPKNITSAKLYKSMTYGISEIIKKIKIEVRNGKYKRLYMSFDVPVEIEEMIKINEFEWFVSKNRSSIGRCFSLQIPEWIKERKVIFLYYIIKKEQIIKRI